VERATTADAGRPLRIALLSYRSKPHCGGQGVYVRNLSRELVALGHDVEVVSGPPYPDLDPGVRLTQLPSLDLYRDPDPFRTPHWREFRSPIDVLEYALMGTAAFPEPLTFSLRAWRELRKRPTRPDVVHDNQTLGHGIVDLLDRGIPIVETIHHPLTVDIDTALDHITDERWRASILRWYAFVDMQKDVAVRLPRVLTVSNASRGDIVEQLVLVERRDLGCRPALRHLHQHRRRRLRDRAAAAGELHLVDRLAVVGERDVDRDLVAAERVLALGLRVRVLQHAVPARVLVVIEDDLAIQVVERVAHAKTFLTVYSPSTSWSISSCTVYR
jgi:glycosyltransferase involved in cell wall biosynthesis